MYITIADLRYALYSADLGTLVKLENKHLQLGSSALFGNGWFGPFWEHGLPIIKFHNKIYLKEQN